MLDLISPSPARHRAALPFQSSHLAFIRRCSGTAKRTSSRPLGEERHASVKNGNILCARTLIVCMIAAAVHAWWVVEQPKGSWMEEHPCFQDLLSRVNVFRHSIQMIDFGSKSSKPTWLYSRFLN